MSDKLKEVTTQLTCNGLIFLAPEGVDKIELVFMRTRYVAFTNQGVFEIENGTLETLILDVCFTTGDVFKTWELEIAVNCSTGVTEESWVAFEYEDAEEDPEFFICSNFYNAQRYLEKVFPNDTETALDVLLALFAARKFYLNWTDEEGWKRAALFYKCDQKGVVL